jgi:tripartite ATP-independent transporter DctP family solute receptor
MVYDMTQWKKKIISAALVLAMALSFGACGSSAADNTQDEVQRYAWPLGTSSPEDTVTQIYAEKFAEEVSRLSDGSMKISVYANSVLGGDRELLESCKDGDIPFVVQNTAPQVTFMPDIAVFDMPCLFDTIEEVREHVDSQDFLDMIQDVYKEGGYELLGYADQGFRVMTTNKNITDISDFKGQKIRTMENSYHLMFWKQLGASPTPMTFSEVYIGLQQGTIDAQENPYEVIVSNKLYEQQDYVVETNHLPHLISLIVSDEFMQGLPEEQQAIIREAAETAKEYAREQSDERIASRIQTIEDSGSQIITLDEEMHEKLRELSQPVYDEIQENVSPELIDAYLN